MSELTEKECVPCKGEIHPLEKSEQQKLLAQLDAGWQIVDGHHLERTFKCSDFKEALNFTNKVGAIAEDQGHHPDITLSYGKVKIVMWTHAAGGLTQNDFIVAAKVEEEY